jgi:hypothetical protein
MSRHPFFPTWSNQEIIERIDEVQRRQDATAGPPTAVSLIRGASDRIKCQCTHTHPDLKCGNCKWREQAEAWGNDASGIP